MEEYRLIGERLEKELLDVGKEKHYRDLIELIDRIADYIFKESSRVKKGIGEIMGGQVLELVHRFVNNYTNRVGWGFECAGIKTQA